MATHQASDLRRSALSRTLPENQRRKLFLEYRAIVRDIEAEEETERLKALESLKTKAADETAAAEARLTELLQQRANLKEQYAKMQAYLERMEKTLDAHKARIEEKEQRIQHGHDGSVLFRFGDEDETTEQTDPSPFPDPATPQSDSFVRISGSDGLPVRMTGTKICRTVLYRHSLKALIRRRSAYLILC